VIVTINMFGDILSDLAALDCTSGQPDRHTADLGGTLGTRAFGTAVARALLA